MHGLLRCNINTGVRAHVRSGRVTQWCHNSPDGKRGHAPEARGGFGEFLRKLVELSWDLPQEKTVDFRLLAEALGRCRTRWGGGRWKSQNRKNVYLSPYVEEPLNSKVIKSFVPEQRSRKCSRVSRFLCSMLYIYIYIYEHYMSISHMAVSGYGTHSRLNILTSFPLNWYRRN